MRIQHILFFQLIYGYRKAALPKGCREPSNRCIAHVYAIDVTYVCYMYVNQNSHQAALPNGC